MRINERGAYVREKVAHVKPTLRSVPATTCSVTRIISPRKVQVYIPKPYQVYCSPWVLGISSRLALNKLPDLCN